MTTFSTKDDGFVKSHQMDGFAKSPRCEARDRPLNIVDCGLVIGVFQGAGRNLVLFKAQAAN